MFAKKIVAGAALLAVAAAAQAGVNVYGTVDLGVGSFLGAHADGTKRMTKVESGLMTTSFIGFSGSEDLGGGLKAEFALESFINADTGANGPNMASGFWSRASNIALSGSFGKVTLGQYDNPFFTMGLSYNPFGASMTMSPTMRHYYGGGLLGFDTGWVNSITYETPNLSGFTGTIQWAPKEVTKTTTGINSPQDIKDGVTISGAYTAGPLSLMAVYASAGNNSNALNADGDQIGAYLQNTTVFGFGASYDFGVVKAFGQYTDAKDKVAAVSSSKQKAFQLGVSVPVSAQGAILASYGEAKDKATGATTSTKNKVFSLAYDHVLSKRTDAYVGLVNERETSLKSGTSFAVGLRHNF
jgi:predicted porin